MSSTPRSRTLLPLLIAALVVVALIVVTLLARGRQLGSPEPVTDSATDAPATAMQGPKADAGTPSPRPALSRQDARAFAMQTVERGREARRDSVKRTEALRTRVAAQFDAEKIDPAWAPAKQVDLEKISSLPQIATSVAAPTSMSVSCKSSMCRIDSAFDSNGSAEDWTMLYMASVGSALPNAVVSRVQNPDGTTSVRIYGRGR